MFKLIFNLIKAFSWVSLFLGFGLVVNAQHTTELVYDSAKNVIRNTRTNVNWQRFTAQLKHSQKGVTIIHLGDSHIQGGYFTNRVRALLYDKYGIRERGFVFPYSLIKANGSEDVRFYSPNAWEGQKYNHSFRKGKAGISGYHLSMMDSVASLTVALRQGSESKYPFQELSVYHEDPLLKVTSNEAVRFSLDSIDSKLFVTHMFLNHRLDSIQLRFGKGKAGCQLYGIELKNNRPGITYHTMGVNGASFETFTRAINFSSMLKALQPDCIIISLGTNDCYFRQLDTLQLKRNICSMVESIKHEFPKVCILLTTPNDYLLHKKYLNPNLPATSELIKREALELGCAYWDFFEVMGGLGSSKRWKRNGFMYKDILHLSKDGYKLQGDLFFKAFSSSIENTDIQ